jgi:hypothetical protein
MWAVAVAVMMSVSSAPAQSNIDEVHIETRVKPAQPGALNADKNRHRNYSQER